MPFSALFSGLERAWAFSSVALLLIAIAAAASVFHLARISKAPTSLRGLRTSWLSREIALTIAHATALALWCGFSWLTVIGACASVGSETVSATVGEACTGAWTVDAEYAGIWGALSWLTEMIAIITGALLVKSMYSAYALRAQPAWNGRDTLAELGGVGALFGGAVSMTLACIISPFDTFAEIVYLVIMLIGCAILQASVRMRMSRLDRISAEDGRPRVSEALSAVVVQRADRRKLLLLAWVSVALSAVAVGCAISNAMTSANIFSTVASEMSLIALPGTAMGPLGWIAFTFSIASTVTAFCACYEMRNLTYELSHSGRTAVQLHRW